jgi:hypothetical protein
MTSDTTYTPVSGADSTPQQTSPQVSSQGSSTRTSPPGRFTPDLDSEDEEEPYILAGAGEDGYELAELGTRGKSNDADTAREAEEGLDSDDEHETWVDRSRRTSVQSFQLYTPDEARAVRRKLDTHLVLFVAL